jgi:hypothetical protein
VLLQGAGIDRGIAALAGMASIAGLRLAAIYFGLSLPVFSLQERDRP